MRSIHKYKLTNLDLGLETKLRLPYFEALPEIDPVILSAGFDCMGEPCVWVAHHSEGSAYFEYTVKLVTTGSSDPVLSDPNFKFLTTLVFYSDVEVWHVYHTIKALGIAHEE